VTALHADDEDDEQGDEGDAGEDDGGKDEECHRHSLRQMASRRRDDARLGDGCGRVAKLLVGGAGGDGADLAGGGIGQLDEVGDARARGDGADAVDGLEAPGGASCTLSQRMRLAERGSTSFCHSG